MRHRHPKALKGDEPDQHVDEEDFNAAAKLYQRRDIVGLILSTVVLIALGLLFLLWDGLHDDLWVIVVGSLAGGFALFFASTRLFGAVRR